MLIEITFQIQKNYQIHQLVGKAPLTGEEKAMVINYILVNSDLTDIPQDYKVILKKKI